ncbi:MAG: helix-turn-helix domain-containing protein [Solirubrobacterales bacterium]
MRHSKDPQQALGAALVSLREEKELSLQQVAKRSGLGVAHYCAVEDGYTNPMWATVRRIAEAIEVSVKDVADREVEYLADDTLPTWPAAIDEHSAT